MRKIGKSGKTRGAAVLTAALFSFASVPAGAATEYWECNAHGVVINKSDQVKIYLGKSCDAFSPQLGSGRWWYTASALAVQLNGIASLLQVEPDCPELPYCQPE